AERRWARPWLRLRAKIISSIVKRADALAQPKSYQSSRATSSAPSASNERAMRSRGCMLRAVLALLSAIAAAQPAWADVAIQAGPRVGLKVDDGELFVGGDVRLSFSLSPLTVNLSFDYYFVEGQTLFQIGATPLYYLPISTQHLSPYVGAGMGI